MFHLATVVKTKLHLRNDSSTLTQILRNTPSNISLQYKKAEMRRKKEEMAYGIWPKFMQKFGS